jgi:hypothetical protein
MIYKKDKRKNGEKPNKNGHWTNFIKLFFTFLIENFAIMSHQSVGLTSYRLGVFNQGSLTEGEGSVPLTSLY